MTGYDEESEECELYTLDYLASMVKAPFAAHGYGGFFTTAIMDRDYRKGIAVKNYFLQIFFLIFRVFLDMNEQEAYDLMKSCVKEVQKRLIINLPNFQVQTISKEGIKNLEDITVKNLD